ncbi:hypothetical protein MTYP_01733 [Methylophilaceae bacterium]|nr:hypothetical protein MTYP_01733 [Methylophilaceae bacterium]
MKRMIPVLLSINILMAGCSPPDQTPKIAEDQRQVLEDAKKAVSAIERSTEQRQQGLDEQTD